MSENVKIFERDRHLEKRMNEWLNSGNFTITRVCPITFGGASYQCTEIIVFYTISDSFLKENQMPLDL